MAQVFIESAAVAISKDERAFFINMGARIARLRKAEGITQAQLAELLGTSQQTITAYEVGRRRVPVSNLPKIAKLLGVSIEELIGEEAKPGKRGPAPKIQQQMERVSALPKSEQRVVMRLIDSMFSQASRGA